MKIIFKFLITTLFVVFLSTSSQALDLEKLVEDTKEAINKLNQNKDTNNTEQNNPTAESDTTGYEEVQNYKTISKENDKGFVWGIQFNLNRTGYKVGFPNGVYGDETRRAIEEFEKDRGLPVTGKPTELLAENLKKAVDEGYKKSNNKNIASTVSQSEPETDSSQQLNFQKPQTGKSEHVQILENKDSMKHIQTRLIQMEYYKGNIDGEYGKDTYMAVKSFQVQRKLKNAGHLSFALIDELDKAYKEGHTINSEKGKYAGWKPCNHLPKTDDEEICYPQGLWHMMGKLENMGYVEKFPHSYHDKGLHEKHRVAIKQFQKDRNMDVDGRATNRLAKEIELAFNEYEKNLQSKIEAEKEKENNLTWKTAKTSEEKNKVCQDLHKFLSTCSLRAAKAKPEEEQFFINECKSHKFYDSTLKLYQKCN